MELLFNLSTFLRPKYFLKNRPQRSDIRQWICSSSVNPTGSEAQMLRVVPMGALQATHSPYQRPRSAVIRLYFTFPYAAPSVVIETADFCQTHSISCASFQKKPRGRQYFCDRLTYFNFFSFLKMGYIGEHFLLTKHSLEIL
jgi:hypothetical protein